jgi:glycosyltransferase involved in cell wall biosynthesis
VAIDARAAVRPELGGVERWARELVARLPELRPGGYTVMRPPRALAHRAGHAWEQLVLPARTARAPGLVCPANVAPLGARNAIVVIHDAAALRHPAWYSRTYANWQRLMLPRIARFALRVVTVSEFSRRELRELLGVDATVVPGGVDERFTPDADPEPARRALGLARPYVLCVASQTARKNLAALAGADGDVEIVVAGGHRPQFAAERGLAGLRLLGHVDDALLPGLYAGARAFVLPSLYEGFGLPVLEAMASGTPVLATIAGALPETCGDAARLVEPDPEAIRAGLHELLADPGDLRERGLARAGAFSWERTARELDAVVQAAIG